MSPARARGRKARSSAGARTRPVYAVAPIATLSKEIPIFSFDDAPREPPRPLPASAEPPALRLLKVYAFDPSLGRRPGNVITVAVPYEKLRPGPVGERIVVVDYDMSRDCFYDPVDLDDPLVALRGGVDPSESDPHFHQQMVYAVVSETLGRFENGLGRTVRQVTPEGERPLRLYIYPHVGLTANAFSTLTGELAFGYFPAGDTATGRTLPGQTVFACLSHDVVVHTATHGILQAVRPDLAEGFDEESDTLAFHESFADLSALLLHFSHREALLDTIQRTAGVIYRSVLRADGDAAAGAPRIQAELAANNPLLVLASGFGEALGMGGGLRQALLEPPDPTALDKAREPHQRGQALTAAVLDAFFSIYMRRSTEFFRIYRSGGGRIDSGDLPQALAGRLAGEATRLAVAMFNVCVRAIDYCPASGLTFGDFLRACITADCEHNPIDELGVRDELMQAFRMRGIRPLGAPFFSEDALRWPVVDPRSLKSPGPTLRGLPEPNERSRGLNQAALRAFIAENAKALSLRPGAPFDLYPLQIVRRSTPDDRPRQILVSQVVPRALRSGKRTSPAQPRWGGSRGGVTLVFDGSGNLRFAIRSG